MWRYGYQGADQNEPKFGFCPLVLLTCISSRVSRAAHWQSPHPGGGQPDIVFGMRDNERNVTVLHFHLHSNQISRIRGGGTPFSSLLNKLHLREENRAPHQMHNRDVCGHRFRFLSLLYYGNAHRISFLVYVYVVFPDLIWNFWWHDQCSCAPIILWAI